MANIERAIKAALAKRWLEFSLKDETLYLGGTGPMICKMVKMFWSFCQQVMGLLPDVYDMLLGVTNSIVMQDRVAKLNDKGISACVIRGHSVLHYTMSMMMAAISNYHWIDLRTLCVYDKKIQAFLNVYCKPLNITRVHLIPNISPPIGPRHKSPEYKPSSPLCYSTLTLSFNIHVAENDI